VKGEEDAKLHDKTPTKSFITHIVFAHLYCGSFTVVNECQLFACTVSVRACVRCVQADIHGYLHGRECREDVSSWLHHGSIHLPERCVELARLHCRHSRVILLSSCSVTRTCVPLSVCLIQRHCCSSSYQYRYLRRSWIVIRKENMINQKATSFYCYSIDNARRVDDTRIFNYQNM